MQVSSGGKSGVNLTGSASKKLGMFGAAFSSASIDAGKMRVKKERGGSRECCWKSSMSAPQRWFIFST